MTESSKYPDNKKHHPENIYSLEEPDLQFDTEGVPSSGNFGDVYFSRDDGLAESEYIFIQQNNLAERWKALDPEIQSDFVIGETGFGTGLNFLAACKLWLEAAPASCRLHFISTELYPLTRTQLENALKFWPSLGFLAEALIRNYPPRLRGMHVIPLFNNRIRLQLHFGDASDSFANLISPENGLMDAWFLDGFSPAKNPGMWHEKLFSDIERLSKPYASATTFTVAGVVKNGLREAGFTIEKVAGHGRKRQMLRAIYHGEKSFLDNPLPYWAKPDVESITTNHKNYHVAIIGAGLAGCTTANALAERGFKVSLIERENTFAKGASGNRQGVLYNTLSSTPNKINLFSLYSVLYSQRFYKNLLANKNIAGSLCGHLELIQTTQDEEIATQLKPFIEKHSDVCQLLTAEEASGIAGIQVNFPALYFPNTGWLSPADICEKLIAHPDIQVLYQTEALELKRCDNHWKIVDPNDQLITDADIVIIANAADAKNFSQTNWIPVRKIRGQTTEISATNESCKLKTVICHDGYIAPQSADQHCIGATFDLHDESLEISELDHQKNLQLLGKAVPDLISAADSINVLGGRVSFRTTSTDYLPLCGPVPIVDDFLRDYHRLRYDARFDIEIQGSYWPNLYLNTAHGARGLSYTPLCADWLTSLIVDGVRPIPADMSLNIHPARFIIKNIIRNKM